MDERVALSRLPETLLSRTHARILGHAAVVMLAGCADVNVRVVGARGSRSPGR